MIPLLFEPDRNSAVRQVMPPRIARVFCAFCLMIGVFAHTQAELSEKIRSEITASMPKFAPPPPDRPSATPSVGTPAPLSDDPLVTLPAYHIREKNVPDKDPDAWMSRRALDHKAMSEYSDSMTNLEWLLNCWYIPFVTPSPQARANARYAGNKMLNEQKRLTLIAETIARIDSPEAKKLLRDLDLSRHPGK